MRLYAWQFSTATVSRVVFVRCSPPALGKRWAVGGWLGSWCHGYEAANQLWRRIRNAYRPGVTLFVMYTYTSWYVCPWASYFCPPYMIYELSASSCGASVVLLSRFEISRCSGFYQQIEFCAVGGYATPAALNFLYGFGFFHYSSKHRQPFSYIFYT